MTTAADPAKAALAAEQPTPAGLPRVARFVGAAIAPTTLITALLFYFGWSHAYYFFDYFGVHSTTLGLTTSDYLMRSQDGLFVPIVVLALIALAVFRLHQLLVRRIEADPRKPRWRVLLTALTVCAAVAAAVGLVSVVVTTPLNDRVAAAPVTLASGVALLAYATHLRRSRLGGPGPGGLTVAEAAIVFVLVGLSLFWAANDYSAAVGRSRAAQFVGELGDYPDTIVYSARNLNIAAPGVRQIHCPTADAAFSYRYDGLKLVLQSGNQYVFVPRGWTTTDGVAVLVPRSSDTRLVFVTRVGQNGAGADPAYACSPA